MAHLRNDHLATSSGHFPRAGLKFSLSRHLLRVLPFGVTSSAFVGLGLSACPSVLPRSDPLAQLWDPLEFYTATPGPGSSKWDVRVERWPVLTASRCGAVTRPLSVPLQRVL